MADAGVAELPATARPRAGKGAARAVRREGKVPAVIYGDKKEEYRKIVEKLMQNTGILCKDDMNSIQRRHLRKKVITNFRRQVVPRPQRRYNVGGTMDED